MQSGACILVKRQQEILSESRYLAKFVQSVSQTLLLFFRTRPDGQIATVMVALAKSTYHCQLLYSQLIQHKLRLCNFTLYYQLPIILQILKWLIWILSFFSALEQSSVELQCNCTTASLNEIRKGRITLPHQNTQMTMPSTITFKNKDLKTWLGRPLFCRCISSVWRSGWRISGWRGRQKKGP